MDDERVTTPTPTPEVTPEMTCGERLLQWIVEHDDRWSFTLPYIAAAVVLSVTISLFWLVVVVCVHAALEWVRQRQVDPRLTGVLARMGWDLKLDVSLVLLALALALYIDVLLGLVGLGHAARLGVQAGARAAGWGRAIQGVLISLDDAAHLARMVGRNNGEGAGPPTAEAGSARARLLYPWRNWGFADWLGLVLGVGCLALILLTPVLRDVSWQAVWSTLAAELQPLPRS